VKSSKSSGERRRYGRDHDEDVEAAAFGVVDVVGMIRSCLPGRPTKSGTQPELRRGLVVVGLDGFPALLVRWYIDKGESGVPVLFRYACASFVEGREVLNCLKDSIVMEFVVMI